MQGKVVIRAGMVDNSGDMDVAGGRKFVADTDAGTQTSGSQCHKADVFRYAKGGINRNNNGCIWRTVCPIDCRHERYDGGCHIQPFFWYSGKEIER